LTEGDVWKKHHDILKNLLRKSFSQDIILDTLLLLHEHWNAKLELDNFLIMLDSDMKK
jgi:hypothetical protein